MTRWRASGSGSGSHRRASPANFGLVRLYPVGLGRGLSVRVRTRSRSALRGSDPAVASRATHWHGCAGHPVVPRHTSSASTSVASFILLDSSLCPTVPSIRGRAESGTRRSTSCLSHLRHARRRRRGPQGDRTPSTGGIVWKRTSGGRPTRSTTSDAMRPDRASLVRSPGTDAAGRDCRTSRISLLLLDGKVWVEVVRTAGNRWRGLRCRDWHRLITPSQVPAASSPQGKRRTRRSVPDYLLTIRRDSLDLDHIRCPWRP